MEENLSKKIAVISIDVEDWYHLEYFINSNPNKKISMLDGLYNFISLLSKNDIKATYFFVGELIDKLSNTIIDLHNKGNDIAIHSFFHKRPIVQSPDQFKSDIKKCKKTLLKYIDVNPGYRAPCFALDRSRLDVLISEKIKYDSSLINAKEHPLYVKLDVSGFLKDKSGIYIKNNFKEFEISTLKLGRISIPISGGGYLRILPWFIYKSLLKKYLKNNSFYVFYIHPFELSDVKINTFPKGTSLLNRFRFNYNRIKTIKRLQLTIDLLREEGYSFKTFKDLL